MAIRIDKCVFEILTALSQAELLALCEFIQGKIARYEDEMFKAAAYVNTAAEQVRQIKAVGQIADGLFDQQITASPLRNIAKDIAPSCARIEIVFQGISEAGSFTQASRDSIRSIGKQLEFVPKFLNSSAAAAEESIAFLTNLCAIIQRMAGKGIKDIEKVLKKEGVLSADNILNPSVLNNPITTRFP